MRIRHLFNKARAENKKLFIPYITCGDPSLEITMELVKELVKIGADIIELAVPFSDPLADGITNQLSALRALKHNVNLKDCCSLVKKLRAQSCDVPIVLFSYFNPIFKFGLENFVKIASEANIDAVLIVDLPVEEAAECTQYLLQKNIGSIFLISPTTTLERIKKTNQATPEFLYYISRTGVTGTQETLSTSLEKELTFIKQHTTLPIAVGFGISNAKQAATVANLADGVIVGSALVKKLATKNYNQGKIKLIKLAANLAKAIKTVKADIT